MTIYTLLIVRQPVKCVVFKNLDINKMRFFKPTVLKIILIILTAVLVVFTVLYGMGCGFVDNKPTECKLLIIPVVNFLNLPNVIISTIFNIRINILEKSAIIIIALILEMIWVYILACSLAWIISKIYNKIRESSA